MAESIQEIFKRKLVPVRFERTMGLLSATTLGIGFLIYFFYSRKREVRARTGMSLVLSEQHKSLHRSNLRILVPMANPQTQPGQAGNEY